MSSELESGLELAPVRPGDALAPTGVPLVEAVPAPMRSRSELRYFASRNPKFGVGSLIVALFGLTALIGPRLTDYAPYDYVGPSAEGPSSAFWLGTTTFGQDVYTQFVLGIGSTFAVGLLGGGIATVIGMAVGFSAGYRGGRIDELLSGVTNIFLTIPVLAVLLIVTAYIDLSGVTVEAVLIGCFSWPWIARAVRAQTFTLRNREFVDLARLSGFGPLRIVMREIAPNMNSYLMLVLILSFGHAILTGAFLEFLGLGPPDAVTLGSMLNNAVSWGALQLGVWWWFVPPGAAITALVSSLYLMNVGLDEVFNPRLRET
jgi:peptide/nickel transport system permease protein